MFEKFMIRKEYFQNTCHRGKITGFQFGLTITAYHGKVLEEITGIQVRVDGEEYPESAITFNLRGRNFTMEEMRQEQQFIWGFKEIAIIKVAKEGGLAPGDHELYVNQRHKARGADASNAYCITARLHSPIRRSVSLYSYQQEYYKGELDLEGMIRAVHDTGADGIEILAEQTIPNYPNPSQYFIDKFRDLLDKYEMNAICYDANSPARGGAHSPNPNYEVLNEKLKLDIRLAAALGFKCIRASIPLKSLLDCLPYAEQHGVAIGPEIHSPGNFTDGFVPELVEYINKTGTNYLGIIPDTGIFIARPVRLVYERHLRRGATPELIKYSVDAYMSGTSNREKNYEEVKKLGGNEIDLYYAREVFDYVNNNPDDLEQYAPYILNVHGKSYEVTEDLDEYSIPYPRVISALKRGNYDGYIATEYEGQRHYHDLREFDISGVEQVRRHQMMLKKLIENE